MPSNQKLGYTDLRWGRSPLTEDDAISSFLAVGAAGSGKTIVLRCLMQTVLSEVGMGKGTHGLVYDPKNDAMSILASFVDSSCIKLFNPLDERCVCWNAAKDITSPLEANQLALALVPWSETDDDFFRKATRSIIRNCVNSFNLSKLEWTFADLLRAIRTNEICERVLLRHPQTKHIVKKYLHDPKLSSDISASIESVCGEFEPLAACFERGKEKVSIKECIENEYIVVLGSYEVSREAIQRLNVVLGSTYSFRVLSLPEYTKNRYWQIYDEVGEAGQHKHLIPFAKLGRSKGGRLVIAFQALSGLQQARMFGKEGAEDMLSNFGNRFIGRVEDPTTAQWLSDYIGEQDAEQISSTRSFGKDSSRSETRTKQNQRTLLPSQFMSIPHCGNHSGLTGLFKLRSTDAYWDHIKADVLFGQMLIPQSTDVKGFIERSSSDQYLDPWCDAEEQKFAPAVTHEPNREHRQPTRKDLKDSSENAQTNALPRDIDLTSF